MLLPWARCFILTRADSTVFGYTEHDRTLVVDGVQCTPVRAVSASSAEHRIGGGVDTIDVATVFNAQDITRAEVEAGLWDDAELRVIQFNWATETIVREFLTYSVADAKWVGNDVEITLESKGAVALNKKSGIVGAPNCGHEFGGTRCGVDRTAYRETMEVTGVSDTIISGVTPTAPAGQWQGGRMIFGSESIEIAYVNSNTIYLVHPFAEPPDVGDTVTLEVGCGKTTLQCKTFSNFEFFGGFGHRAPNASAVTEIADSEDGVEFDGGSRFES